jgi:hypothetical protein
MPAGRYASAGEPLPELNGPAPAPTAAALELSADVVDLESWLVATLRTTHPDALFSAIARAERTAANGLHPTLW